MTPRHAGGAESRRGVRHMFCDDREMSAAERWRLGIGHSGHIEIRLRLLRPDEGARDQALQSGFRARWILGDDASPSDAPVDLLDGRRSIKPGETAMVWAYPLQPERWNGVAVGDLVSLHWKPGRTLGVGEVMAMVDVPRHAVPFRNDRIRQRPGAVLENQRPWHRNFWRRSPK